MSLFIIKLKISNFKLHIKLVISGLNCVRKQKLIPINLVCFVTKKNKSHVLYKCQKLVGFKRSFKMKIIFNKKLY